jgi:hypothetical protein
MTRGRLYVYDALLERLAEHLEDMTPELAEFVQEEHAMVYQRHLARHRDLTAADPPHIGDGVMGARNGRVVTNTVRWPVRLR